MNKELTSQEFSIRMKCIERRLAETNAILKEYYSCKNTIMEEINVTLKSLCETQKAISESLDCIHDDLKGLPF